MADATLDRSSVTLRPAASSDLSRLLEIYAWHVLNPSYKSHQQVELSTTFSASIAALGDSKGSYTDRPMSPWGRC